MLVNLNRDNPVSLCLWRGTPQYSAPRLTILVGDGDEAGVEEAREAAKEADGAKVEEGGEDPQMLKKCPQNTSFFLLVTTFKLNNGYPYYQYTTVPD